MAFSRLKLTIVYLFAIVLDMKIIIVLCLLVAVNSVSKASDLTHLSLESLIKAAEIKYDLPVGIIQAMVTVESAGKLTAINKDDGTKQHKAKGIKVRSYGLTQIQLDSARFMQKQKADEQGTKLYKRDLVTAKQLMIPEINLDYGAMYLKWLLENHENNMAWALSCYNAGPNSYICKHKKYGQYVGLIMNAWLTSK